MRQDPETLDSLLPPSRQRFDALRSRCLEMKSIAQGVAGSSSSSDDLSTPALDRLPPAGTASGRAVSVRSGWARRVEWVLAGSWLMMISCPSDLHLRRGRSRHRSDDLALFRRALYRLSYPTADLTGFEPATSGLTGRRALQTAPQVPAHCCCTPNGIRTRAAALKGRCPRPLDDGGRVPLRGLVTIAAGARTAPLQDNDVTPEGPTRCPQGCRGWRGRARPAGL